MSEIPEITIQELVADYEMNWRKAADLNEDDSVFMDRADAAQTAIISARPTDAMELAAQLRFCRRQAKIFGCRQEELDVMEHVADRLLIMSPQSIVELAAEARAAACACEAAEDDGAAALEHARSHSARSILFAARPSDPADLALQLDVWTDEIETNGQLFPNILKHIAEQLGRLAQLSALPEAAD